MFSHALARSAPSPLLLVLFLGCGSGSGDGADSGGFSSSGGASGSGAGASVSVGGSVGGGGDGSAAGPAATGGAVEGTGAASNIVCGGLVLQEPMPLRAELDRWCGRFGDACVGGECCLTGAARFNFLAFQVQPGVSEECLANVASYWNCMTDGTGACGDFGSCDDAFGAAFQVCNGSAPAKNVNSPSLAAATKALCGSLLANPPCSFEDLAGCERKMQVWIDGQGSPRSASCDAAIRDHFDCMTSNEWTCATGFVSDERCLWYRVRADAVCEVPWE